MEENKSGNIILNIKNNYVMKVIFRYLKKNKFLTIIKYNKRMQKIFEMDLDYYRNFAKIEIELELINLHDKEKPILRGYPKFINYINEEKKQYYHIYFNNDYKKEIYNNCFSSEDIIEKIKIVIDYNIDSLCGLFKDCKYITKIRFTKFYRKDIIDMSYMFYECSDLEELDISNIYTDNVADMRAMFFRCFSLKKLNVSKFKTDNITDMSNMFYECSSLTELDLSNFNTKNVCHMSNMFSKCYLLKDLNVSNFNTENVTYMPDMFSECCSLKDLNISSFNFNNVKLLNHMFALCPEELKDKIKKENKSIGNEAFE